MLHHQLNQQPAFIARSGNNQITAGKVAERSRGSRVWFGANCELAISFKVRECEDGHNILPYREVIKSRRQLLRTLPPTVVDKIVTIRSYTQLAEPTEHDIRWGIDRDAPKE